MEGSGQCFPTDPSHFLHLPGSRKTNHSNALTPLSENVSVFHIFYSLCAQWNLIRLRTYQTRKVYIYVQLIFIVSQTRRTFLKCAKETPAPWQCSAPGWKMLPQDVMKLINEKEKILLGNFRQRRMSMPCAPQLLTLENWVHHTTTRPSPTLYVWPRLVPE